MSAGTSPVTLSQATASALADHAHHAFGLMGNGNAHLIDALQKLGVPYTAVRHEAATVASADAFARVSGRLALATTTYGAGFTNTLTALAEARQARTPLLLVVGDAPVRGARPWDVDQEQLASGVDVSTLVLDMREERGVAQAVARAVAHATRHRVPVVLAIPYDRANSPLHRDAPPTVHEMLEFAPETPHGIDEDQVGEAARALVRAERLVILAGLGAHLSRAGRELDELQSLLGAVTASTALARGLFSDASHHLGVTGGFGQGQAMGIIAEADVVLVVGASLNQFTMRFGELFGEGARVIRVDRDNVEAPSTFHPIRLTLVQGDAREVLRRLIDKVRELDSPRESHERSRSARAAFAAHVARRLADGSLRRHVTPQPGKEICRDGRLDPRAVAARLAELLPHDAHITQDGGHFIAWANMFFPVTSPERMTMVGTAYQTIGLGFGTVPGVAAAAPGSTVVLSTGDGGGLMALADMESAIRVAERLIIIVWNDGAYGAEVHLYGEMGLDRGPMLIPEVNFAGVASALGAEGVRVERLEDLDALTAWCEAGAQGTILLDCRISNTVMAPYQREVQRANGLIPRVDPRDDPCDDPCDDSCEGLAELA